MTGPSLKYPGAKWGPSNSTARWVISNLPQHVTYCEPFFGSGGVFFSKPPSAAEYINDLDGDVVNLFRVMRDQPERLAALVELTPYARAECELSLEATADPVERARRTLVRYWMAVGSAGGRGYANWRHSGPKKARSKSCVQEWARLPDRVLVHAERLRDAHIECAPALEVLGRLNHPSVLSYIDPPYLKDVRKASQYRVEMLDDAEHVKLLTFLAQDWQGMAVVSGYAHPLYDELLTGWGRLTRAVAAEMGQSREEVLWISPNATKGGLF